MKDECDKTESDSEVEYFKSKKEYKEIISLDCFTLFQKIYTQLSFKNKLTLSDFSVTLQVRKLSKFKVSKSTIKYKFFFVEISSKIRLLFIKQIQA